MPFDRPGQYHPPIEDGEHVNVAHVGDHGGYVEVLCDENGEPIRNSDGSLPLPVPPGEDGVDNGKGGYKGLSQNDMSWCQEGTVLVGNASLRDDAQLIGPDAIVSGADQITGEVGVGGSNFRSSGECMFEGNGTYIDMTIDKGAAYEFSGGTQIGGPAHFMEGEGKFQDDPETGNVTMMFAAREGSEITVQTYDGFESNGLTALDDTSISGKMKGNSDLVIQDSDVHSNAEFKGGVTIVNQELGIAKDGKEILVIENDEQLDSLAKRIEPKDSVSGAYETSGMFDEQADYLTHVSDVITHELGENYADSGTQHHYDDVHAEMNNDLENKWREIQEIDPSMSRQEFDELYRNLSGYQDGINDGVVEDHVQARKEGGDKAVAGLVDKYAGEDEELRNQLKEGGDAAVQAYLDENGIMDENGEKIDVAAVRKEGAQAASQEYSETKLGQSWGYGSSRRYEAQPDSMKLQTSGTSQWKIGGEHSGEENDRAAEGLQDGDRQTPGWKNFQQEGMADEGAALTGRSTEKPRDWRLTAANNLNLKQVEDKGDEYEP